MFELTILGTSAAVPYKDRYLAGQVLNVQSELYLIDCGEGTQFRIKDLGIRKSKINHIFISHLHGDHCFGLFGVLTSMAMSGRTDPLSIYSPSGLKDMIETVFQYTYYQSPFTINFNEINTQIVSQILENQYLTVTAFPLYHRIPTIGFLIKEKPFPLNIIPEKIEQYQIPYSAIKAIKNGGDYHNTEGGIIPNSELTLPPYKPRSYAYCSDTAYNETLVPILEGVDMLYHEATFMHDMADHATETGHSTTIQAATIAQVAGVGQLIIGHYSSRYENLNILLDEAKSVFENTVLGIDGNVYSLDLQRII
jgi:ribonuclease Z